MHHSTRKKILIRDLSIVGLSVIIAILMVRIGVLEDILSAAQGTSYIGSFIAGIFFTSVFTIAPASVALAKLASNHSVLGVALWGGIGAAVGDLIILLFIRDSVSGDIDYISRKIKLKKILRYFHLGFLRILTPFLGALVIASPLPDELGLAMMGLSKVKIRYILPIAFVMNVIGIILIAAVGKAF